jgi:hypothetical protein
MKIRPVGAELFHADGRTNRHDDILDVRAHHIINKLSLSYHSNTRSSVHTMQIMVCKDEAAFHEGHPSIISDLCPTIFEL